MTRALACEVMPLAPRPMAKMMPEDSGETNLFSAARGLPCWRFVQVHLYGGWRVGSRVFQASGSLECMSSASLEPCFRRDEAPTTTLKQPKPTEEFA